MMSPPRLISPLFAPLLAACLACSACTFPVPSSNASAAAHTACRARADEVFAQQNRGAIYSEDNFVSGLRDSPFGSNGVGSVIPTNLANQFGREQTMQQCLDGISTTGQTGTASDLTPK